MMLLEVLVILEVQRCERYFMGEAARRDPHIVDRTRASALECCCGQAAPDGTYRLIAWQHGNAGQSSGQFLAAVGAPMADFSPLGQLAEGHERDQRLTPDQSRRHGPRELAPVQQRSDVGV
jgi:hypothetical protein